MTATVIPFPRNPVTCGCGMTTIRNVVGGPGSSLSIRCPTCKETITVTATMSPPERIIDP